MTQPRRTRALVTALSVNAALLGGVLVVLLSRGGGPGLATPAYGAPPMAPIAGGGGVFLMPAQFSVNTWGCYVFDVERRVMCTYQFLPGEKQLRFVAARNFGNDLGIPNWNTSPDPNEVARMVQLQQAPVRGKPHQQEPDAPRPDVAEPDVNSTPDPRPPQ